MSVLKARTDAIGDRSVEVIDLTAPLSAETPIISLPEPFGNTARFGLTEISHYDERGPAWYWNDIVTGEHTGTHSGRRTPSIRRSPAIRRCSGRPSTASLSSGTWPGSRSPARS
jgi:hypothetical protein